MRIPYTVSKNSFEAYRCSVETLILPREQNRTLHSENDSWDENIVPELKILALRAIVSDWKRNPIFETLPTCEDKDILLEILPTNLPFKLVIKEIPYEYYWERASKDRWEFNNLVEHGNSWRQLYCERHFAEYLESLDATYFDVQQETCEETIELLRDFIYSLKIRSLVPTKNLFNWTGDENDDTCTAEEFPLDHIPMNSILPKLPNLTQITLSFGMIYFNDGFEWRDFEFSVEDCLNLGRGIKDSRNLKKFALTKSNLDQHRVAALLQGVAVNNSIEEIDLSHCKLKDKGAHAVGCFLTIHRRLKVLHLANNKIGPNGVVGIIHGLLQDHSVPLKHLNLRLNPLQDAGGVHVCALLLRHARLEVLNISGCGFGPETGIGMSDIIGSGHMKCSTLELDVSNNDFGPIAGQSLDKNLKICPMIVEFDSRLCNFSPESDNSIRETILRHKINKRRDKEKMYLSSRSTIVEPLREKSLMIPSKYALMESSSSIDLDDQKSDSSHGDAKTMDSAETIFKSTGDLQSTIETLSKTKITI